MDIVDQNPEKLSPNVLTTLYQELILPNIAYFRGRRAGYWLELKSFFDSQKLLFPILCLRNMEIIPEKSAENSKSKLDLTDLLLKKMP